MVRAVLIFRNKSIAMQYFEGQTIGELDGKSQWARPEEPGKNID
jgi:hypothetical protein